MKISRRGFIKLASLSSAVAAFPSIYFGKQRPDNTIGDFKVYTGWIPQKATYLHNMTVSVNGVVYESPYYCDEPTPSDQLLVEMFDGLKSAIAHDLKVA